MQTTHRGRTITITASTTTPDGCCTFTIGDSGPQSAACLAVSNVDPSDPHAVLAWLTARIDEYDDRPVDPRAYPWWYAPGTVTRCPHGHTKALDADCADPFCAREAAIAARRAALRTGITAASLTTVLTRAGHPRAARRHDGTAKSIGFSCGAETVDGRRNARVCVLWHDGISRFPGDALPDELHAIARTLTGKGYRVEVHPNSVTLRVYPKGSQGSGQHAYTPPTA
ncbi:hypothetical protein ACWDTQ_22865 [Streptomyces cellulosae]|uniref:Uncharacterized protein n=1 Tax=Streptomyces cellulosae TaxID=1968 RepID=A0ABW6JIM1_STRCE